MSIRQASRPRSLRGEYAMEVVRFVESGWGCAEVDVGDNLDSAYNSMRAYVKRHDEYSSVRVVRHGDALLLVRVDVGHDEGEADDGGHVWLRQTS